MLKYVSADRNLGVKFPKMIMSYIQELCAASNMLETGGILIGEYSSDMKWAIVHRATMPTVGSRRFKASFIRNGPAAKDILDKAWDDGMYYLGEWHYHPCSSPVPSRTDRRTIFRFANDRRLHCPEPIMLIIGGNSPNWREHVSVYTGKDEIVLQRNDY